MASALLLRLVTREELESPRNAKDYLPWVEARIRELGDTKEGTSAVRLRRGFAKQLIEEALPLAIFATKHYGASRLVTIQHRIGNQTFDAKVVDRRVRKSPFKYIEITQAHEGAAEHYRMIALERDGHVNILGKVQKSGTKRTGIRVNVANEAQSHAWLLSEELARIAEAIDRKLGKPYVDGTALVVAFDDYLAIRSDDDMQSLRKFVLQNVILRITNFRWLAFVGWGKRNYLEFDLKK